MQNNTDLQKFIEFAQAALDAKGINDEVSRKFAIAIHFGMKKFPKPVSQNKDTRLDAEIQAMSPLWTVRETAIKYQDIPPTLPLWMLVVAFTRYALAVHRIAIDPKKMVIQEHGKPVDVWDEFTEAYCYIILSS